MKLEINNEKQEIKNEGIDLTENTLEMAKEIDYAKSENNVRSLTKGLEEEITNSKLENINLGVDKTINDVTKTLENNIEKEIERLKLDDSIWEKISKSKVTDVVKVAIEAVLKGILKKKFGINFSTFNEMKDTINDVMDGNLKEAVKSGSDAAIDKLDMLDSTTRLTIKTIKNAVVDKTIDSEKYEIVNKQTKILNRISKNCEEFNEALKINDADIIKKRATSIKNDMQKILPIKETIARAQCILDKYSLWQNKGNKSLTTEENDLIEKLHLSA